MGISVSSYTKGMNQDAAPLKYPQENYFDAENFRIVTDDGGSSFTLENTKGNSVSFQLPGVVNPHYILIPSEHTTNDIVRIRELYLQLKSVGLVKSDTLPEVFK